jgi:hypothetical protein
MKFTSFNGRFLLEPYAEERVLKTTSGSGFARIQQKVNLKPLKLVLDFEGMVAGSYHTIPKGSLVYVKEEYLYNDARAKQIMEGEGIEGKFIIVESSEIQAVKME